MLALLLVSLFILGAVGLALNPVSNPGAFVRESDSREDREATTGGSGVAMPSVPGEIPPALRQQLRNLDTAKTFESIADSDASDAKKALRYIEEASRHQLAALGGVWREDVLGPKHEVPSEAVRALAQHLGGIVGPEQEAALAEMDALPLEVGQALADVIDAFHAMDLAAEQATAEADPDLLKTFEEEGVGSLTEAGVDLSGVLAARLALAEAAYALKEVVEETGVEVPSLVVPASHEGDPEVEESGICINAHDADNVYASDCTLLLDTGEGDTRYHNNAGGKSGTGASALIDFGGTDEFGDPSNPRSSGVNGGGSGGVGFLMSLGGGSDVYSAGDGGVNGGGSAAGGVGFLFDQGGDDFYVAKDGGVNGGVGESDNGVPAGAMGLLIDVKGNDEYQARDRGTNGGSYNGLFASGLLLDVEGNDIYWARDSGTNGGSKILSGLFYSLGGLLDFEGDDLYHARSGAVNGGSDYEISFTTSYTSGILYDGGGNDFYEDISIGNQEFAGCVFIPSGLCKAEDTESGTCSDCTIVAKGTSIAGNSGPGFQVDFPGDGIGPQDVIQTDCDQFASQMTCWIEVAGTQVTVISPYIKEGDDQKGATADPLKKPLTVMLLGGAAVDGQEICFQITSTPSGGEDARLVGLDGNALHVDTQPDGLDGNAPHVDTQPDVLNGNAPNSDGTLCTTSGDDGRASVHLILGSVEGEYTTRAWNGASDRDRPGFVEFTSNARVINAFQIERQPGQDIHDKVEDGEQFAAGEGETLHAGGLDANGAPVADVEVQWTVTAAERGSFSAAIASETDFTGGIAGPATITASRGGVDVSVNVEIVPGALEVLQVRTAIGGGGEWLQPSSTLDVDAGTVLTLHAAGYDAQGNFRGDTVTDWSVPTSNPNCGRFLGNQASVTSASAEFHVTNEAGCPKTITAAADDDNDIRTTLGFRTHPAPLDSIVVRDAPNNAGSEVTALSLAAGESSLLYVAGYDEFGNYRGDLGDLAGNGAGLVWDLEGLGIVEPENGGFRFTAQKAGNQRFDVQHSALDTDSIRHIVATITHGEATQVGFHGLSSFLVAGEPFGFDAQVQDAFGNVVPGHPDGTVILELADGGSLQGVTTMSTDNGVAVFSDLSYAVSGISRLTATLHVDGQDDLLGETDRMVLPADLDHFVIRDTNGRTGPFTVIAGESRSFVATAHDAFENRLASDMEVDWDLAGVGNINPEASGVSFQSQTEGSATLTVHHAEVPDATATIDVVPDALDHISFRNAPSGKGSVLDSSLGTLRSGEVRGLYAAGWDEHGNFLLDLTDDWIVDPPSLGTFDETGTRFTAQQEGSGTLTVVRGGVTAVLGLSVVPGDATRLSFSDEPLADLVVGEEWPTRTVRIEDAFGNLVTDGAHSVALRPGPGFGGDLRGTLEQVTLEGIATFNDVSYSVAEALWIVASAEGLQSAADGPYQVSPADLHKVVVRDANGEVESLELVAGNHANLHAIGLDAYGNTVDDVDVTWSLDGVGRIVRTGDQVLFTAFDAGEATLVADLGLVQATVDVQVTPGALERIEVRDAAGIVDGIRLSSGSTRNLHATGHDAWGNVVPLAPSWSVEPSELGTIKPTSGTEAVFTAEGRGSGTFTVRSNGVVEAIRVIVEAEGNAPTAIFKASCAGLACAFDASDSMPGDAAIAAHAWDFGDGSTAKGGIRTYDFGEAGDHQVTLLVEDTEGRTNEAVQIVSLTLPPRPLLQLQVDVKTEEPEAGKDIEVVALVENVGATLVTDVTLAFLLDGERVHVDVVGDLPAGASHKITTSTVAQAGSHTMRVQALGWEEAEVLFTVAESGDSAAKPPSADASAPGLLVPLGVLLGALWVATRRRF